MNYNFNQFFSFHKSNIFNESNIWKQFVNDTIYEYIGEKKRNREIAMRVRLVRHFALSEMCDHFTR